MRARRDRRGTLVLDRIPPFCADALARVPAWLEDPDPALRARLFPRAYADPSEEEEWRRLAAPELAHLFQGRLEVVQGDLASLAPGRPAGTLSLVIPAGHESAWLSSLNAARIALFERHRLEPADMGREPADLKDPVRALALLRIHALAWVQELLLGP